MDWFWQDLRFSFRALTKSPGFAAIAVLSLALGIGANTTIFTLINAIFLNPLPVEKPSELLAVYTTDENNTGGFLTLLQTSYINYKDYRDQNEVFTGLAAYAFPQQLAMTVGEEPEQVFGELVTGNYFEVLGVKPSLGRFLLQEEDTAPGKNPVVVLSHRLWQRRFGGDPNVLGRSITLNGTSFIVIGVGAEGFIGVNTIFGADLWVPTMMYKAILPAQFHDWFDDRRPLILNIAGRLKPGTTEEEAEANLKTIAKRLREEYPGPNKGRDIALIPLVQATIFPGIREALLLGGTVLMVVVGLVLLIACSNVANLLLARATARRKEIAIRLSMGAARPRLVRQLLTESTLLALLGGAVGLVVAVWGRDLIWSLRPPFLAQNVADLNLDGTVLLFTLGVSLLTGVVFGLAPAFQASKADVIDALKEETRTAGRSRRFGLKSALVVGQVALSIVSLVAAGLFLRSLQGAHHIDPGFETDALALMTVSPGQRGYDQAGGEQFYQRVLERVSTLPGVRSATWSANLPLFGGFMRSVFLEGQDAERGENRGKLVYTNAVGLEYFETAGVGFVRGRSFSIADREESVSVAIINETMAARFWPDQDPLGKRFRFYGDDFYREVIGIARNAKYVTLGEDPQPAVYVPMAQNYQDAMNLYLRTQGEPAAALGAARTEVRALDPQVPITNAWTVSEVIDQSLWAPKLGAVLLSILGVLALALAAVGIYGVMAYTVNQRHHEIGLRMALGARQPDVLRLVLLQGMKLVGLGLGIGLAIALLVSRAVTNLLYGISPADPTTFLAVTLVLVAVALFANLLPAHRASRVDPLIALRYE